MRYKRNALVLLKVSEVIHPVPMSSPKVVYELMRQEALADRELFWVLHLNAKNRIVKKELAAMGAVDHCVISPSMVLRGAVACGAAGVITVHNHPSGDPSPSEDDRKLWRRLNEGCQLLGLRLLDNIVVGSQGYYSEVEK